MNKKLARTNKPAVALITAHEWVGVSTPVVMTATYLAGKGYLVDIYMTEDDLCDNLGISTPSIKNDNIEIYKSKITTQNCRQIITTPSGLKIYAKDLKFIEKYISPAKKYDWIVGFDPEGLIRAALLSYSWDVPYIYHSLELYDQEDACTETERLFSQQALLCLIQDEARADILAKTNGINRDKIEIAYNSSLGGILPQKNDYFRKKFGIPKNKTIVLATGTLLSITCIDQIIDSVDNWPANFVLVLHGWIPDKSFESEIYAKMEANKEKIFLSTKILEAHEKNIVFQSADIGLVFYNPVDTNLRFAAGSAGKIFDFMRAGVPIVGNDIPGMSDLLEGNGCGIVVRDAWGIGNVLKNVREHYNSLRKKCLKSFPKYEFGQCYEKLLKRIYLEIASIKKKQEAFLELQETNNKKVCSTVMLQTELEIETKNKLRETDILIASYPRAGNTWVRNLLADILLQLHNIKTDTNLFEETDRIIPDIHQRQLHQIDKRLELPYRLVKTHDLFNPLVQKTIYIFRQAPDSLCSYYYFCKDIEKRTLKRDINNFCIEHMDKWYEHVNSYVQAYKKNSAKILFISYELLHNDPIWAILSMVDFLGLKVNKKMCERAIQNQEFKKHKKQSKTFYRKGIIGSSKEEIKETTLICLENRTKSLYEKATKLIYFSDKIQKLEQNFGKLKVKFYSQGEIPYVSKALNKRALSFIKEIMDNSREAISKSQFELSLRLIVMAKFLKIPVCSLDYMRAVSFLGMGEKNSAIEALKEELRHFPQNSDAKLLLKDLKKTALPIDSCKNNTEFQALLNVIRPYTMVGEARLFSLYLLAKKVCEMDIPGNFVECGVAGGGSSAVLATVIMRYSKRKRILFAFDSFKGMPAPTEEDVHQGIFADATGWGAGTCAAPEESIREICQKLGVLDLVKTVKGFFKDTLPIMREEVNHIAFLHMDGDWYESTHDILNNIYDLVDNIGIIQVDDYGFWDGCKKAISEFEKKNGINFEIHNIDGTGIWFQKHSKKVSSAKEKDSLKLLNLGCGSHYKEGWLNVDFKSTGSGVIANDLNKGIPFEDNLFDAVYHSHLLEHFSKAYAHRFISECYRILKDGGIIRVVVPDLQQIVKLYLSLLEKALQGDEDAQKKYEWILLELFDQIVRNEPGGEMLKYWQQDQMPAEGFVLERVGSEAKDAIRKFRRAQKGAPGASPNNRLPQSVADDLRIGAFRLSGEIHQWMYDRYSLANLIKNAGFEDIKVCKADESRIPEFNSYLLDIEADNSVRKPESLFMEALKPIKSVKTDELNVQKMGSKNKHENGGITTLKVVHLCTHDFGGAGKAAYRLHKGLQKIGADSKMLVLNKKSNDPTVKILPIQSPITDNINNNKGTEASSLYQKAKTRWNSLLSQYPNRPDGLEIFTDAFSDVRLDLVKEIHEADIINLHWVAGTLDYVTAPKALNGKRVLWTLHDMNSFTGGCHYSGDCKKYELSCSACPQLGSIDNTDLAYQIWNHKLYAYQNIDLTIITPSRWLGSCAYKSKLFSGFPIHVIPNGLPVKIFKPYPKSEIRSELNIPQNAKVILFGAESIDNKRKGFKLLLDSINNLSPVADSPYILLTFGHFSNNKKISCKYPIYNLGHIGSELQLALAYSAADVFVIPSIEDNLPNTVIEAMACGIPVVGFKIGGVSEIVEHKRTGFLVDPKDINGLKKGIEWIFIASETNEFMLNVCRKKAISKFSIESQAQAYYKLYQDI